MKTRVLVFIAAIGVLAGSNAVPEASAELSQGFRNNLQKQYESGQIPDPNKNMSYEERLAIRKKQQKLEEENQRNKALQPTPSPYPQRDDGYDRHSRQRRDDRYSDPSEQSYRDCQRRWRPGSSEFSRCMHDNRDRYDSDNRYDDDGRYDRRPSRY